MVKKVLLLFLFAVCLSTNVATAGVLVHFNQDEYIINPGDPFNIQILLDMDDSSPGQQVPATGLFAMGLKLTFDADQAQVGDISDIVLPTALNDDGVGGLPLKSVGSGFADCYATVGITALEGYMDPLLATITITDLNIGTYPYSLNLDFYFSDTITNFADFVGNPLDADITFGSATVVPEPSTISLLILGGFAAVDKWRRK